MILLKGELFVANLYGNSVSIISDSNNKVVANVTVGGNPGSLAYDSVAGEVFATIYNNNPGTVSVISVASKNVVETRRPWRLC